MRKNLWIALVLVVSLLLSACAGTQAAEQTTETTPKWENSMQKSDPALDDTLNVLMVGNSFCYYYPDELYAMAEAAGIKMRICNVYYSGCKVSQHWTWWKNKEANYSFHENGIKLAENVDLEYCLKQGNWDIISLQTADSITGGTAQERLEYNKLWLDELFGYFRQEFPASKLAWQQTWAYQVGTASNGVVTENAEAQRASYEKNREISLLICETYDLIRINTGEAWQIVRDGGYDNLCARLGKAVPGAAPNTGDNYHDGDIGGGQYLNACVWFEVLTGQSCVGNSYVPAYSHGGVSYEMLIDLQTLQNAAHQAVANLNE